MVWKPMPARGPQAEPEAGQVSLLGTAQTRSWIGFWETRVYRFGAFMVTVPPSRGTDRHSPTIRPVASWELSDGVGKEQQRSCEPSWPRISKIVLTVVVLVEVPVMERMDVAPGQVWLVPETP